MRAVARARVVQCRWRGRGRTVELPLRGVNSRKVLGHPLFASSNTSLLYTPILWGSASIEPAETLNNDTMSGQEASDMTCPVGAAMTDELIAIAPKKNSQRASCVGCLPSDSIAAIGGLVVHSGCARAGRAAREAHSVRHRATTFDPQRIAIVSVVRRRCDAHTVAIDVDV